MNQLAVSAALTAALWLAGHLVRRKLLSLAREAGYEGEFVEDFGTEVPHCWLVIVCMLDLLHEWRPAILGGLFIISFVCVHLLWPMSVESSHAGFETVAYLSRSERC